MQFAEMYHAPLENNKAETELLNELNNNWDAYLTGDRGDQSLPLFGSIQQKKNPQVAIFFGVGEMIHFSKSFGLKFTQKMPQENFN